MENRWHCVKGDPFWIFEWDDAVWEARYESSGREIWCFQVYQDGKEIGSLDFDVRAGFIIQIPSGIAEEVETDLRKKLKEEKRHNPYFTGISQDQKAILQILFQALLDTSFQGKNWIDISSLKRACSRKMNLRKMNLRPSQVESLIGTLSPKFIETDGDQCCLTLIGLWAANREETERFIVALEKSLRRLWGNDNYSDNNEYNAHFERRSLPFDLFFNCLNEPDAPLLRKKLFVLLMILFPNLRERHLVKDPDPLPLDDTTFVDLHDFMEHLIDDSRNSLFSYLETSQSNLASPFSLSKVPEENDPYEHLPKLAFRVLSRYRVGEKIGRWTLLSQKGIGGQSEVWEVTDGSTPKRSVVMKICDIQNMPKAQKRTEKEISILGSMSHPNVISIIESGSEQTEKGKVIYYVMPEIEHTLGSFIKNLLETNFKSTPFFTPLRWIELMIDMSSGVNALHQKGYVHRDIKEDNFLFELNHDKLIVKIADLGVALDMNKNDRITQTGEKVGNRAHMPAEVSHGDGEWTMQGDIYSLASVFRWMMEKILGKLVFSEEDDRAMMDKICALKNVFAKAMRKDPSQRHDSVDELMRDLIEIRDHR